MEQNILSMYDKAQHAQKTLLELIFFSISSFSLFINERKTFEFGEKN